MGYVTDLIGRKFGQMTVVARAKDCRYPCGARGVIWKCRCECGNEKEIKASVLCKTKNPHYNCGCKKLPRVIRISDMSGQRYGRLLVLKRAPSRKRPSGGCITFWLCKCDCGAEKEIQSEALKKGKSQSCGCLRHELICARRAEKNPNWLGGRTKSQGYVLLTRPIYPGHELNPRTSVFEHIVVMARHLGRPLRKGETVHHKNGIRDDNRIENLELWAANHGSGQRVEDLVAWAKEVLLRYNSPNVVSPCCI